MEVCRISPAARAAPEILRSLPTMATAWSSLTLRIALMSKSYEMGMTPPVATVGGTPSENVFWKSQSAAWSVAAAIDGSRATSVRPARNTPMVNCRSRSVALVRAIASWTLVRLRVRRWSMPESTAEPEKAVPVQVTGPGAAVVKETKATPVRSHITGSRCLRPRLNVLRLKGIDGFDELGDLLDVASHYVGVQASCWLVEEM